VRVLVELGLASYADRRLALIADVRADLDGSALYQRCQQQLMAARAYLATAVPVSRAAA
jgi:hypothetical protein